MYCIDCINILPSRIILGIHTITHFFVGFANDIGDEEMRDENVVVNMETDQPGSLQERPLPSKFALSAMCK